MVLCLQTTCESPKRCVNEGRTGSLKLWIENQLPELAKKSDAGTDAVH